MSRVTKAQAVPIPTRPPRAASPRGTPSDILSGGDWVTSLAIGVGVIVLPLAVPIRGAVAPLISLSGARRRGFLAKSGLAFPQAIGAHNWAAALVAI